MAGWRPKIYRVLERCEQTHLVGMEGGGFSQACGSSRCWHKREERTKRLKLCSRKAFGSGEQKEQCNN